MTHGMVLQTVREIASLRSFDSPFRTRAVTNRAPGTARGAKVPVP
jgi:hypothetical protein